MDISKEKLLELRNERGWSQNRLALISGLGERTIQRIEKNGVCSAESAMALASAFELSPKDLQGNQPYQSSQLNLATQKINVSGIAGLIVLIGCAAFVITLTAKYPRWEWICVGLVFGITMAFSCISYGAKQTLSCLAATYWIIRVPPSALGVGQKVRQTKSLLEYTYIVGIVSSLVCGLTIMVHSDIDLAYTQNYLAYIFRPMLYAILIAELWLRPLKHRLEYILQLGLLDNTEASQ